MVKWHQHLHSISAAVKSHWKVLAVAALLVVAIVLIVRFTHHRRRFQTENYSELRQHQIYATETDSLANEQYESPTDDEDDDSEDDDNDSEEEDDSDDENTENWAPYDLPTEVPLMFPTMGPGANAISPRPMNYSAGGQAPDVPDASEEKLFGYVG